MSWLDAAYFAVQFVLVTAVSATALGCWELHRILRRLERRGARLLVEEEERPKPLLRRPKQL